MKTIHKFPLEVVSKQEIMLPKWAKVMSVGVQKGVLCVWVMLDDTQPKVSRCTIWVCGTGHNAEEPFSQVETEYADFIGTVQMHDGDLIWHVFASRN